MLGQYAKTIQLLLHYGNFCWQRGCFFQIGPRQAQKQARLFSGRERAGVKSANSGLNARVTPTGYPGCLSPIASHMTAGLEGAMAMRRTLSRSRVASWDPAGGDPQGAGSASCPARTAHHCFKTDEACKRSTWRLQFRAGPLKRSRPLSVSCLQFEAGRSTNTPGLGMN